MPIDKQYGSKLEGKKKPTVLDGIRIFRLRILGAARHDKPLRKFIPSLEFILKECSRKCAYGFSSKCRI